MVQGPAHHDGGSLAGKDSLFDSSTRSRTGSGSAGLRIGRPTASSSLIVTVGRGRGARSGFMSHTMAGCGAWRPGSCATRRVAALIRAHLSILGDPGRRSSRRRAAAAHGAETSVMLRRSVRALPSQGGFLPVHTDIPTGADLERLLSARDAACVSIYLP